MDSIKLFIVSYLVMSNALAFQLLDALALLQKGKGAPIRKLKEEEVYNGVKKLLRAIIPEEDEQGQGVGKEEDEGFGDRAGKASDEEENGDKNSNSKDKKKGSKYTNVNFVLYNSGIKFQKQDDITNRKESVKMRFNCVLVVASSNKCYGWDAGQKNPSFGEEHERFNFLRTMGSHMVAKAMDGNFSGMGLAPSFPRLESESPPMDAEVPENTSRYRSRRFLLQNTEDDFDEPSAITIFL